MSYSPNLVPCKGCGHLPKLAFLNAPYCANKACKDRSGPFHTAEEWNAAQAVTGPAGDVTMPATPVGRIVFHYRENKLLVLTESGDVIATVQPYLLPDHRKGSRA